MSGLFIRLMDPGIAVFECQNSSRADQLMRLIRMERRGLVLKEVDWEGIHWLVPESFNNLINRQAGTTDVPAAWPKAAWIPSERIPDAAEWLVLVGDTETCLFSIRWFADQVAAVNFLMTMPASSVILDGDGYSVTTQEDSTLAYAIPLNP